MARHSVARRFGAGVAGLMELGHPALAGRDRANTRRGAAAGSGGLRRVPGGLQPRYSTLGQ